MTTKREIERQTHQQNILVSLGFTNDESEKLRRISLTLRRWHELECGTGEGQISRSVERDTDEGRPYIRVQYPSRNGYVDRRYPCADRETGAKKRLATILAQRNARPCMLDGKFHVCDPRGKLTAYIQTDPRGAALYILRPGDVPEGEDVSCYYSRGICVY